jgi:hypothetical protein
MTGKVFKPEPKNRQVVFRLTESERMAMDAMCKKYGVQLGDIFRVGIYYFDPRKAEAIAKFKRELPKVGD